MGHVIRCLALADMLRDDFEIVFAIQEPKETIVKIIHSVTNEIIYLPQTDDYISDVYHFLEHIHPNDIVVLDGYNFGTQYQQNIKNKGCKLVAIDDLHNWHHVADVIINHAANADDTIYSKEEYSKLYWGFNYALLRKPFLTASSAIKKINSVKKVFISMGAADITNITQKFTEALIQIQGIEEIHLILGTINPNLKRIERLIEQNKKIKIITHFDISAEELAYLLKICDISICPASSISLESCAIGIGLISGYTAKNQFGILQGLINNNVIINFGDLNLISISDIKVKFNDLILNQKKINSLIENQKKMIDGRSPERLKEIFKNLISGRIHFRFAKESDTDLYFKWANDNLVRSNSFNQNKVEYENHIKWFSSKLNSKDAYFYFFLNEENIPVGQVRIDKSENEAVIGISIDEAFRGKSLGSEMLKQATDDYLKKHPSEIITAYIKIDNKSSYSIFKKAGFLNEELITEQGHQSYKLYKKLDS